jgi:hypothetical protein
MACAEVREVSGTGTMTSASMPRAEGLAEVPAHLVHPALLHLGVRTRKIDALEDAGAGLGRRNRHPHGGLAGAEQHDLARGQVVDAGEPEGVERDGLAGARPRTFGVVGVGSRADAMRIAEGHEGLAAVDVAERDAGIPAANVLEHLAYGLTHVLSGVNAGAAR